MKNFHELIYLTGTPASGKSTLCRSLQEIYPSLHIYEYGKILTDRLNETQEEDVLQSDLKEKSSQLISTSLVKEVDEWLLNEVNIVRNDSHVIIDSHAVTKESYGLRVIPFSASLIRELAPTRICTLFADPGQIIGRIESDSQGRPIPSVEELEFHASIQASVAINYSIICGSPCYFLRNSDNSDDAMSKIRVWLG